MARVWKCLTPSQGVALVNSMIEGTKIQTKLMKFKKKYSQGSNLGRVGEGYWAGFMKRQVHLLVSKRKQKYDLNRSTWSTYANFVQMYEQLAIK